MPASFGLKYVASRPNVCKYMLRNRAEESSPSDFKTSRFTNFGWGLSITAWIPCLISPAMFKGSFSPFMIFKKRYINVSIFLQTLTLLIKLGPHLMKKYVIFIY